jgi:hypothetical protein
MDRANFFGRRVAGFLVVFVSVVAVLIPASQPARAASSGECVTALVDAPFRLPDGRIYPAGALTLCDYGTFSPVDTMHRILVGGSSIGLFRSRRRNAEAGPMDTPQVVFNRGADGNLELVGYALSIAGHTVAYRMKGTSDPWEASARQRLGGAGAAPMGAIVATARVN